MTLLFECDGPLCGRRLGRHDRRLELNDIPAMPEPATDELVLEAVELRTGADACDRHFCSWECLAAWATTQIIDNDHQGDTAT